MKFFEVRTKATHGRPPGADTDRMFNHCQAYSCTFVSSGYSVRYRRDRLQLGGLFLRDSASHSPVRVGKALAAHKTGLP